MKKVQLNRIKHFGSIAVAFLFIFMATASISEFFVPPTDQKGICSDIDPVSAVHTFHVKVIDALTGVPIPDASVEIIVWQLEYKRIDNFYCAIGSPIKRSYELGTFQTNGAGEVQATAPEITFKLNIDYAYVNIIVYKGFHNQDFQSEKLLPGSPNHYFTSAIYNINIEP